MRNIRSLCRIILTTLTRIFHLWCQPIKRSSRCYSIKTTIHFQIRRGRQSRFRSFQMGLFLWWISLNTKIKMWNRYWKSRGIHSLGSTISIIWVRLSWLKSLARKMRPIWGTLSGKGPTTRLVSASNKLISIRNTLGLTSITTPKKILESNT